MLAITLGSSSPQIFYFHYFPGAGHDFRNISSTSGICCDSQPQSLTIAGLVVKNIVTSGQAGKTSEKFQQWTKPYPAEPGGESRGLKTCMHKLTNRIPVTKSLAIFEIEMEKRQIIEIQLFNLSNDFHHHTSIKVSLMSFY